MIDGFLTMLQHLQESYAPASSPLLILTAALSILMAWNAYRAQSLPVFAGVFAIELLVASYVVLVAVQTNANWGWLSGVVSRQITTSGFWFGLAGCWSAVTIRRFQSSLTSVGASTSLSAWLAFAVITLLIIFCLNAVEGYVRLYVEPTAFDLQRARLIVAGLSGVLLLLALILAAIKTWRHHSGLWLWLSIAGATWLAGLAYQFLFAEPPVGTSASLVLANLFIMFGLLADRTRFLQTESEARRTLMERNAQLEAQASSMHNANAHVQEALAQLDLDERLVLTNQNFLNLTGAAPAQWQGKRLKQLINGNTYEALHPLIQEARRQQKGFAEIAIAGNGEEHFYQVHYAPIINDYRKLIGVFLGLYDLTPQHAAKKNLEQHLTAGKDEINLLRQCVEGVTDALVVTDLDCRVMQINHAFERMTGFSREEIQEQDLQKFPALETLPLTEIKRRLSNHQTWRGEVRIRSKASHAFPSELTVVPLEDDNASVLRYLWIVHDLSARREWEEQLQLQAESLRAKSEEITALTRRHLSLLNSINDILVVVNRAGRCTFINEHGRLRLGLSEAELSAPGRLPAFFEDIQRLSGDYGDSLNLEFREHRAAIKGRNGELIHCVWNAHPLRNDNEERAGVIAIGREQPASKAADEFEKAVDTRVADEAKEFQRRNEQLRKLMQLSEDIRLNLGLDKVMASVASAIQTLGWTRVAVFLSTHGEHFDLTATAGFDTEARPLPRSFRKLTRADFSAYLLERYRLSNSFYLNVQHTGGRPSFLPRSLDTPGVGQWSQDDCLLVPVRMREELQGVILAFSPEDGERPSPDRIRALEAFADDAAIAIENSRLLKLHQHNEWQARLLARIGSIFDAAGTLENSLNETAKAAAQALHAPCLVVIQPQPAETSHENGIADAVEHWLLAVGYEARKGVASARVIPSRQVPLELLNRIFARAVKEKEFSETLSQPELQFTRFPLLEKSPNQKFNGNVMRLRARRHTFGFVMWIGEPEAAAWEDEQTHFARELINKATLAIDNSRLFHYTQSKAHELERANRHISEFLASVSHELRTPLHSILQFSEILLSGTKEKLTEQQQQQIGIIETSGRSLLALINNILDLSKIEAGKMEAVLEEFDLVELIQSTAAAIRPLCEKKGLLLRLDLNNKLPRRLYSDRAIVERVLTNLLSNGVKFTDRGGIAVAAAVAKDTLRLTVQDTGLGIPARRMREIFQPFRQLETSESRRHGGSGLGLAISRRLLELVNGTIAVESKLRQGSKFTVTIPLLATTDSTRRQRRKSVTRRTSKSAALAKKPSLLSRLRSKTGARAAPRILVVEDDDSTRQAMQIILESEGYVVAFAENGEKALLAAQHDQPDLILMDIMMPNMDGYQVARHLKTRKQMAQVPVIALTARAMKGDREKALEAGCDDYLTKPFGKKDILAMIEKWLGQRHPKV